MKEQAIALAAKLRKRGDILMPNPQDIASTNEERLREIERYDAGLLGDGGDGNVGWWHDYIRSELDRAHEFYADQISSSQKDNARLREDLGKVATWREDCHKHDDDMGHERRDFFDTEDWELVENFARTALNTDKENGNG